MKLVETTSVALVLVVAVPVVLSIVCNPNICAIVKCSHVDAKTCLGEVRQHASFCGCCPACILTIPPGGQCLSLRGVPRVHECANGTACINSTCTSIAGVRD